MYYISFKKRPLLTVIILMITISGCTLETKESREKQKTILEQAESFYKEKKYDEALGLVNEALIQDSNLVNAHELRGKLLYHFTDTVEAESEFEYAIDISTEDTEKEKIMDDIISWEIDHGNKEKARRNLRNELNLYENDSVKKSHVIIHVANKFLKMKDTTEAISVYEEALRSHPKWIVLHKRLGNIYANSKNYRKAVKHYETCSKAGKSSAELELNLANSYMKLKKRKAALPHFQLAAEKGSRTACETYREMTATTRYTTSSACCDGTSSSSTGRGTCSHHGGVCGIRRTPHKVYNYSCN